MGVVSSIAAGVGAVIGIGRQAVGLVGDIKGLRERKEQAKTLDDLKGILGEGFEHLFNRTDRNYEEISKNLQAINENYQSIEQVKSLIHTTVTTMVRRFDDVDGQFTITRKELKEGFQRIEALITDTEVKGVMSGLTTFVEDFTIKMLGLMELSHEERVAALRSNLNYFEKATTPQSPLSLHTLLNRILDGGFAVPKTSDDQVAFAALFLLSRGTDTYVDIFEFLITGFEYLAADHYSKSEVEDYNNYYSTIMTTAKEFRNRLYGVGGEIGIIGKVIKEFEKVAKLDFIKNKKQPVLEVLLKKINEFEKIRGIFAEMNYLRQQPNSRILFAFPECEIKTPFMKWHDNKTVQYAIQYVNNGTYSPISDWTPFTIYGFSCPQLDVGDAPPGTTRIIFRRFDQERPQIVNMITDSNQTKVRDIDRDLYDAVLERNIALAQQNAAASIKSGANTTATFEQGRQAIHAAASAGHLQIIRELIEKGADVNAQDDLGYSPLHIAAESGNEDLVTALIVLGADSELKSRDNWTALHMAAKHDHTKTMHVLLSNKKVNRNAQAAGGFTPLHIVVTSGHTRAIEMLCADGVTYVNAGSETLTTPLHLAVLGLNKHAVQTLLSYSTCNVNAKTNGGLTPLHMAASAGDKTIVGLLLGHNATDANAKSDDGWSPLHLAVSLKNYDVIKQLLDSPKTDVNLEGMNKLTSLHLASQSGEAGIVSDLLDHGANLGARDSRNYTALHSSIEKVRYETAKLLIEKGSIVRRDILQMASLTDNSELVKLLIFNKNTLVHGQTPLHNAAAFGNVDLISYVIKEYSNIDAKDESDRTPLHYAVVSGNNENVNHLVDIGADVNAIDSDHSTPLHLAVTSGKLSIDTYLNKTGNASINAPNFKGQTPLHLAISLNRLEVAKHLLTGGAEVNAKDIFGHSSLFYAAQLGNVEFVKHLLEANADPKAEEGPLLREVTLYNDLGSLKLLIEKGVDPNVDRSLSTYAARLGRLDILKYLVEKGVDIGAADASGWTMLHHAVTDCPDNLDMIKYLMETKKIDVNAKTADGETPLHLAVHVQSVNQLQAIKYFVDELGCDITSADNGGYTPLLHAARSGNPDSVRYLIEKKADVNAKTTDGVSLLQLAARNGSLDMVKYLVEDVKCDISVTDKLNFPMMDYASQNCKEGINIVEYLVQHNLNINGQCALCYAAASGCFDVTKFLVEQRVNVNVRHPTQSTPLHFAASAGHLHIVKFLVEGGADVNARNDNRETPLHCATEGRKLEIVQHLVNNGADVRAFDKNGDTALHKAALKGYTDISVYLTQSCGCLYVKNAAGETPLDQATKAEKVDVIQLLTKNNNDVKAMSLEDSSVLSKTAQTAILEETEASAIPQDSSMDSALVDAITEGENTGLSAKGIENHRDGGHSKRSRRSTGARENKDNNLQASKRLIWQRGSVTGAALKHDQGQSLWRVIDNTARQTKISTGWPNPRGLSFSEESFSPKDGFYNGLSTYSSSLNENVYLAKWLLSLFGRRSFVDGIRKAERLAIGEPQAEADWAERYLRQGIKRYYPEQ